MSRAQHQQHQQRQWLPFVVVSLPALVYARDQWGSVCRVRGASMEPELRDGDVLWVRKADAGTLWPAIRDSVLPLFRRGSEDDDDDTLSSSDEPSSASANATAATEERQRVVRYEVLQGISNQVGLLYSKPPAVISGDMVVYRNPTHTKREFLVKRCIGVGGQWIRQELPVDPYYNKYNNKYNTKQYRLQALPPYTVYVEGSNLDQSIDDSRTHGPISKNLMVGVAEYCVWPPTRWQRLKRITPTVPDDPEGSPRAVWY